MPSAEQEEEPRAVSVTERTKAARSGRESPGESSLDLTAIPDGAAHHHVPLQPGTVLGREGELESIHHHLWRPSVQLLSLVGPGGVGKSRLAVEVAACPHVKVMTSSREPLHLRCEYVMSISPLTLPDLGALPPLDVLAAAQTNILSPSAILHRLDERRSVLKDRAHDVPARHRSLAAALASSYDILSEQEQDLLRRLCVFVDGFTLEAAAAIVTDKQVVDILDGLATLVDTSLVLAKVAALDSLAQLLRAAGKLERARRAVDKGLILARALASPSALVRRAGEQSVNSWMGAGAELDFGQMVGEALELLSRLVSNASTPKAPDTGAPALSAREYEVLQLVAQRLSNKQIAQRLIMSENTAKFHMTSILNKLGADSRARMVALTAQLNLLEPVS